LNPLGTVQFAHEINEVRNGLEVVCLQMEINPVRFVADAKQILLTSCISLSIRGSQFLGCQVTLKSPMFSPPASIAIANNFASADKDSDAISKAVRF
jgi:hypothetical protein